MAKIPQPGYFLNRRQCPNGCEFVPVCQREPGDERRPERVLRKIQYSGQNRQKKNAV